MPFAYTNYAAARVGGKLYVAANGDAPWGVPFTTGIPLAQYDPAADIWILRSPTPSIRRAVGLAALGGRLYAVGGAEIDHVEPEETFYRAVATVEAYDPATNQWFSTTSMPTPRLAPALVALGDKLYAIGGGLRPSNALLTPFLPLDAVEEGDPTATPGSCLPSPTTLCLRNSRFEVEVEWRNNAGLLRNATVVSGVQSSDSGLFYFLDQDNWEFLVKILDGCGINNHYWVFFAATTNVEFTVTVTDTETGATAAPYFNPPGHAADAITDTRAFATCP